MSNKFEAGIPTPENRGFDKILSINDNGESLIKLLSLENLKASKEGASNKYTQAYGNSSVENFKKKMSHVEMFVGGYEKKFGKEYKKYPIVDIGTDGNPYISILAQQLGVKGLVSVDVANQIDKESLDSLKNSPEYIDKKFPLIGLKMDMLELLKQLPDNSCNVSMFSIDFIIIKSDDYALELIKQINRVTPKEGVVVTFASILDMDENTYSQFFEKANGVFFKKKELSID